MSKRRPLSRGAEILIALVVGSLLAVWVVLPAFGHTPLLYIEDNEDGTIYVEGGFSDGSSAAGSGVRLEDADGKTLWEGELGEYGSVESVPIPEVRPYYVVFDAGPGHVVTKEGLCPAEEVVEEPASSPAAPAATAPAVSVPSPATVADAGVPAVVAPTSTGVPAWSPAATLPSTWAPTAAGAATNAPDYSTALWVIVALLSVIAALLLAVVCGLYHSLGFRSAMRLRPPHDE